MSFAASGVSSTPASCADAIEDLVGLLAVGRALLGALISLSFFVSAGGMVPPPATNTRIVVSSGSSR